MNKPVAIYARVSTDGYGIFQHVVRATPQGALRARIVGSSVVARPFALRLVRDRFFNPFGLPRLLESGP